MEKDMYYIAKIVSNDIWIKCIDSILICSKCNKELQIIEPYLYDWHDVIIKYNSEIYDYKSSYVALEKLINTEILDKLNFPIKCETCCTSFERNDIEISIFPFVCFSYSNGTFATYCSVCSCCYFLYEWENTDKNRKSYLNEIKTKFIEEKEKCTACGTNFCGIQYWDGSRYVYME